MRCEDCGQECAAVDEHGHTCCDYADQDGHRRCVAQLETLRRQRAKLVEWLQVYVNDEEWRDVGEIETLLAAINADEGGG